ncbi:HAD-IA family hydrolase [Pseudoduganella rhizocola]|uniref:HAD-IA family hydrolase n=1 Tax=Pseudoduganella rhizocola TaxID=3382643 RepID=UPI0038B53E69
MSRYQLLIFDFDGTLADSFPFFLDVFDTLADAHGFRRLERDRLDVLRHYDLRQMMQYVGLPRWKLLPVGVHFRSLMAQNISRIQLFGGMREFLRAAAAKGVQLGIVSSNSEENVRMVLGEDAGLFRYYECGAALFGKRRRLRHVLRRSGVAPDKVLCLGDEVRDIEAAHGAGLDFGAVAWGYTAPQALQARAPRHVFATIADMRATLD